jgi:hypothetical protein
MQRLTFLLMSEIIARRTQQRKFIKNTNLSDLLVFAVDVAKWKRKRAENGKTNVENNRRRENVKPPKMAAPTRFADTRQTKHFSINSSRFLIFTEFLLKYFSFRLRCSREIHGSSRWQTQTKR